MEREGWTKFKKAEEQGREAYRYKRAGGAIWLREGRWCWRVEECGYPLGEEVSPETAANRVEEAFRLRDETQLARVQGSMDRQSTASVSRETPFRNRDHWYSVEECRSLIFVDGLRVVDLAFVSDESNETVYLNGVLLSPGRYELTDNAIVLLGVELPIVPGRRDAILVWVRKSEGIQELFAEGASWKQFEPIDLDDNGWLWQPGDVEVP